MAMKKQLSKSQKVHKSPSSLYYWALLYSICDRLVPMVARTFPNLTRSQDLQFQGGPRSELLAYRCLVNASPGLFNKENWKCKFKSFLKSFFKLLLCIWLTKTIILLDINLWLSDLNTKIWYFLLHFDISTILCTCYKYDFKVRKKSFKKDICILNAQLIFLSISLVNYSIAMVPLVQTGGSLAFALAWGFLPLGSSVKMKAPSFSSMFRYRAGDCGGGSTLRLKI